MAPLTVDPKALSGAGVSVAAAGDGLASSLATLTGAINANTGYDAAGVVFGRQYVSAAGELLKAITSGANACRSIGYGIQMSAVTYSRAEAASDISRRSQALPTAPCPAPLTAPSSPSSGGASVPPPVLWSVVQQFVGSAWPDGNPAELRSAAAAWRAAAGPLNDAGAEVAGVRGTITAQIIDEGPAMAAHVDGIATGVSSVASSCEALATSVEQYATQVEKTQQAIRDLCDRLGSIGGIVGTFFEFVRGHGLDEVHEIADEIRTVIAYFGSEADATVQLLESAKQSVNSWVLDLEKSANKQFVEFFGEPMGTAVSSQFNRVADSAEGAFRWGTGIVESVVALDPTRFASDPEGARQTWEGLDRFGRLMTNPVQQVLGDPDGSLETVKGMVHAEDWSKDRPMVGATEVGLDILSAALPIGKAGALGKARALEESGETNASVRGGGPGGGGAPPVSGIAKNAASAAEELDDVAKQPISSTPPVGGRPVSLPEDATHGPAPVAKAPTSERQVEPGTRPQPERIPAGATEIPKAPDPRPTEPASGWSAGHQRGHAPEPAPTHGAADGDHTPEVRAVEPQPGPHEAPELRAHGGQPHGGSARHSSEDASTHHGDNHDNVQPSGHDGTPWDSPAGEHAAHSLPADDSGYRIQPRDCDFLDITPEQVEAWASREAPLGMTQAQFSEFRETLFDALQREGFRPEDVDVRLQGSSANFFSGEHKWLPQASEIGNPEARARMDQWFGDDPDRPLRRPFDSMHRLGLDDEPSDYDIQISSDAMTEVCRHQWELDGSLGDFTNPKYGFVNKDSFKAMYPSLWQWAERWEAETGRPVVPALFPGVGPPDNSAAGVSSHFRESDWRIHPERGQRQ